MIAFLKLDPLLYYVKLKEYSESGKSLKFHEQTLCLPLSLSEAKIFKIRGTEG